MLPPPGTRVLAHRTDSPQRRRLYHITRPTRNRPPTHANRKPTAMKKPLQPCLAAILAAALATHAATAADESALRAVSDSNGNIAIGRGALDGARNCSAVVAIGDSELAGAEYESAATSINGRQLYVSMALNAFCLNPGQRGAIQETPLWYLDNELHLNAGSVLAPDGDDLALIAPAAAAKLALAPDSFDLYLSERGDDRNDGRSPAAPKRTIHGCYLAATNDGVRVAVFPGTYHTPSVTANTNDLYTGGVVPYNWFLPYTNRLEFTALGGAERTFITGDGFTEMQYTTPSTNAWEVSTNTSAFAFGAGYQVFDGFTVSRLAASLPVLDVRSGNSTSTSAIACLVDFRNCVITGIESDYWLNWGAFNACRFTNTTLTNCSFTARQSSNPTCLFSGCEFDNARIFIADGEFAATNRWGNSRPRTFSGCSAKNSLFVLWNYDSAIEHTGSTTDFSDCTFVWDGELAEVGRVRTASATNCYFAVGTAQSATGGAGNAYAPAWTNTLLGADFAPDSLDCPAVRADGSPDAGWRKSGLGWQKTAKALLERLAALEAAAAQTAAETATENP